MADKSINEAIKKILEGKKKQLVIKIDSVTENVLGQINDIRNLEDFMEFEVDAGLSVGSGSGSEEKIDFIHDFVKKISASVNQLNLINTLLDGITNFCSRAALFLVRDDKLVGWKGKGFSKKREEISDEEIKKLFFSLSANTIFKKVLQKKKSYSGPPSSQPDDHLIYSRFGGDTPGSIFVLPFFVKGKPQAIIYTDAMDDTVIEEKEIEIVASIGEMSLDLLPLRQKILAKVKTKEFVEETDSEIEVGPPVEKEEQTQHSVKKNDPERLARVIINDIILYNQEIVEEGIRNNNLYQVLEDTILQSKELFLNRFDDLKIFEKQLIETLAKGDKGTLKGYKFETL